ncbi:MAG: competence/damage-inducible protein A [Deltaproteobacteria bacterium]|nr:competence/damage-inducible protein A [Deltaproteobacteria bacterium]
MAKTSGIVIIGNEVLSGKTQDINSHFFCTELRQLGVEVKKISTIQDEIELIGREVLEFSQRCDFVFTSGGIGPTHDDVTIEGIAHGFGVKVVRHPDIEARMRRRLGTDLNEARLRMANVPEGAALLCAEAPFAPIVQMHNVYVFPGIPKILQERFHAIKELFRDAPYFLKNVYVRHGEGVIATMLNDLLVKFPELMLGSYPVLDLPEYKVKVTLESKDAEYLDRALKAFVASLPQDSVQRIA